MKRRAGKRLIGVKQGYEWSCRVGILVDKELVDFVVEEKRKSDHIMVTKRQKP